MLEPKKVRVVVRILDEHKKIIDRITGPQQRSANSWIAEAIVERLRHEGHLKQRRQ